MIAGIRKICHFPIDAEDWPPKRTILRKFPYVGRYATWAEINKSKVVTAQYAGLTNGVTDQVAYKLAVVITYLLQHRQVLFTFNLQEQPSTFYVLHKCRIQGIVMFYHSSRAEMTTNKIHVL